MTNVYLEVDLTIHLNSVLCYIINTEETYFRQLKNSKGYYYRCMYIVYITIWEFGANMYEQAQYQRIERFANGIAE